MGTIQDNFASFLSAYLKAKAIVHEVSSQGAAQIRTCKQSLCIFQEIPDGCVGKLKSVGTFWDTLFQIDIFLVPL